MEQLAIITPSYIGSEVRADFARSSLASLNKSFGNEYKHIIVDDIPHFKGRFIRYFPNWRYVFLAKKIYRGDNIRLIRQHGRSSSLATLRAVQEAIHIGYSLVFIHLDDNVYLPIMRDLVNNAIHAFEQIDDLQVIRFAGMPVLSHFCTPGLGNRTELIVGENEVQFDNLTLRPQRFDNYTLWWTLFHENLVDGRFWAIPMWFSIIRAEFLEKLLTLNNEVSNLRTLGEIESYYKNNWRTALKSFRGKLGYINMQFGGIEMEHNKNWETMINFPNIAIR